MKFLLDVNALIAIGNAGHTDHGRASRWVASLSAPEFLTCAISELGFVRISTVTALQPSVSAAVAALTRWKRAARARFIADDLPADRLPTWVSTPARTTDGHLAELASAHGAQLATFDAGIKNAHLIS